MSMFAAYDVGFQTSCTRRQFESEISLLYASCHLEGFGDYYFAHDQEHDGTASGDVYLFFYDERHQRMYRSQTEVFSSTWTGVTNPCMAINPFIFLIRSERADRIITLVQDWSGGDSHYILREMANKMTTFLSTRVLTDINKTGLARIRDSTPGDVLLNGNDGESVTVHKMVVKPLWPFFATAMETDMAESHQNAINLPFPTSTVEGMVRYLYGQELELDFEDAVKLVEMALVYDLPELLSLAIERIKKEKIGVVRSISLWKTAFEAKNDELREFSAKVMRANMAEISSSSLLDGLDRNEVVELFLDVSKA